jgi:hypothetical protein
MLSPSHPRPHRMPSPSHPLPPSRLQYSPVTKRDRHSASSALSYSSEEENRQTGKRQRVIDRSVSPRNFPRKDDEESINSYSEEDDEEYTDSSSDGSGLDDLRDFIDFDPEFNKTNATKRKTFAKPSGDELRDFLFTQDARPRKWFTAFTTAAVGAKLAKKNNN